MENTGIIGPAIVLAATAVSGLLCGWSLYRIRFIHRHRLVRLRQILRELRHGPTSLG